MSCVELDRSLVLTVGECEDCGEREPLDANSLCADCRCIECEDCRELVAPEDMGANDRCADCDAQYHTCRDCGDEVHDDEAITDADGSDGVACRSCQDAIDDECRTLLESILDGYGGREALATLKALADRLESR